MKKITKISVAFLTGYLMLVSADTFAQSLNTTDKVTTAIESTSGTKKPDCFIIASVVTQTNEKCYGQSNGNAAILIVGELAGNGPYTWSWSPTATNFALDTADFGNGLAAGTYTVTMTDALGCTGTINVTITQPPLLTVSTSSVTNDKCYGDNNGSAIVSASGGTPYKKLPAYTYTWAPAAGTTSTASNLTAGTYIVTVSDTNKCTAKDTVTITQPVQIATTLNVVSSSCSASNGSVGVVASKGISPYTYSWSPGGNTTDSITGLGAGTYTCTVTDGNGCSVSPLAIITDSTTLKNTLSNSANEKCYGESIGLAAYTVSGGKGPDTYAWTPSGGNSLSASGLAAGTYTFTATDSVGCKALSVIAITQPKQLRDSMVNIRQVLCYGAATGRTTAGVGGGTNPYSYSWSTGATTSNLNNVAAGTYSVMVTDKNGCMDSAKITLTQPATAIADSNKFTNVACYGGTTSATVYAYNGTPYKASAGYTYAWAPGGQTTNSVSGLAAGTYVVSIRDSNKCRLRDTIIVTQPASFILSTVDTSLSYPCSSKAWLTLAGTEAKYTFSWSPSGGTGDTAKNLCVGIYTVTITDSTGCVETDSVQIVSPAGIQQYANNNDIHVYPNPAKNTINIAIDGNDFAIQSVTLYDVTGRQISAEKVNANTSLLTLDIAKLAEGTYFVKLMSSTNYKIVKFSVAGK